MGAARIGFCAAALLLTACARTKLSPIRPPEPRPVYVGDRSCNVQDFAAATEVPSGAKNLGWVSVSQVGSDEETYIFLRKKVCEMGGDGLSQVAWVRDSSEAPVQLKGNAWSLP